MLPQETIRKRRDGLTLSSDELREFFAGYLAGEVADYQMAAFLMASYFHPPDEQEALLLTQLFIDSGTRLDLSIVQGRKVDKHSTGGVGDKTSLLLAPIVAAAGVRVPMMSGRALGHTGGTLDKLESIPGFRTTLGSSEFLRILDQTGAVLAGQSEGLVPLDKRMYALRDVTGTVEILPFIAASIMSKKIVTGADALVLDVKTGEGAFMQRREEAEELARLLVRVGGHFGLTTTALITDMSEPLGRAIGSWLEVVEVVDCLQGRSSPDLMEVTYALAGVMLHEGRKAQSVEEGMAIARETVRSGLAWERWLALVRAQGGDVTMVEDTLRYPNPRSMVDVPAPRSGVVQGINARTLGMIATEIGAGRRRSSDMVDHTAGIIVLKKRGDTVAEDEALCRLCSSTVESLVAFRERATAAFRIADGMPEHPALILSTVDAEGVREWPKVTHESPER